MDALDLFIPRFDLFGNWLCLDFANTMTDRPNESPHEQLQTYRDLTSWGEQAAVLTTAQAQILLLQAASNPLAEQATLQRALELREAIFQICVMLSQSAIPARQDLAVLNRELALAMARSCISFQGAEVVWDWQDKDALDLILWHVTRSAADLLTSSFQKRVRICAAADCDWLFLDVSKNKSRRWCDMKSCGNRAKVRRYNARHQFSARP